MRGLLEDAMPWLGLVATLGLAAAFYVGGDDERGHLVGFEQAALEALSPVETGKVASILVRLDEEVAPGQVVATLDTSVIDAEIAVARAEAGQLEAEGRADQSLLAEERDTHLEELRRELSRQREEQLQASAEAKALGEQVERVKKLVDDHVAVVGDLTKLDVQHSAVKALAAEKPKTIALLSRQIEAAEKRQRAAREEPDGAAPAAPAAAKLAADLLVARRNVELLEQRRAGYVLRAMHGGRVAGIDKQVGNVAVPGEPVVRVVSARGNVVACVPERSALGLSVGDTARLWIRGQGSEPFTGKVVALGPVVAELPMRCWPSPKLPLWGREVSVALDGRVSMLAGQSFDIVFRSTHGGDVGDAGEALAATPLPGARSVAALAAAPGVTAPHGGAVVAPAAGGATAATTATAGATAGGLPVTPPVTLPVALPMTVPTALTARSRFEPSGVLQRPGEGRYLLVSDDTGLDKTESESAPWLFAMSPGGVVDAEPLVVAGVASLVDVEGITAGDGDAVYVLSSQSYSKKGKRKSARTALLRLRPEGQGFRVDGEAHLAEMFDASPAKAAELGLAAGTRELDLEGLAFHQGALYVGVKAPLDAQGEAMIWKIAAPEALFRGRVAAGGVAAGGGKEKGKKRGAEVVDVGLLGSAGVSPWAHARVDVEIGGKVTPGGISDLQFLADGSLAITSTPSTAEGDAGALWRVDAPQGGAMAPRLVARFPGMKPEGVAASLSPGKVMVVFDAGSRTPSFQEVPWTR
ncbi:HlyD family secretion protein [Chondromyces apiculatus]|uniref:Membrane fusion protein biotin-lipoyl like domain-containing protein n=1 Tax=Chondromyces apiculatus DSM 436 TaxID=1192034 RepID=A0A017T984_9BACT|nr:hypothetical protein [Chondromyces apiculatus]EYF05492.1 Hypothetical protein CAP_3220 [Chondromyces apiculatus DSM 436]